MITTAGSTAKAHIAEAACYDNIIDLEKKNLNEGVSRITFYEYQLPVIICLE